MTKLLEWLLGLGLFTSVWGSLLAVNLQWHIDNFWKTVVLPLPLYLIGAFGVYALSVVLWRVYNFNNCEEAAREINDIYGTEDKLSRRKTIFNFQHGQSYDYLVLTERDQLSVDLLPVLFHLLDIAGTNQFLSRFHKVPQSFGSIGF